MGLLFLYDMFLMQRNDGPYWERNMMRESMSRRA